jgi:hypothetical protein
VSQVIHISKDFHSYCGGFPQICIQRQQTSSTTESSLTWLQHVNSTTQGISPKETGPSVGYNAIFLQNATTVNLAM